MSGRIKKTTLSFEFFPPKTPEMEQKLWHAMEALAPLKPAFVSVTYGAGGGTRERTHHTVQRIARETSLVPAAHLTCVNASRSDVDEVARHYWEGGIRHIVALRGDPPQGMNTYVPLPEGYPHAVDLVRGLKRLADFEITVAAFPEKHPESASIDADIVYLREKMEAGATRAITQYFFDNDHYFRFLDKAHLAGITIPIVPGILPIGHFAQMVKFSAQCGTSVPDWLKARFEGLDEHPSTRDEIAVAIAVQQCRGLLASGVSHLHFYTLNRAPLVTAICRELGI